MKKLIFLTSLLLMVCFVSMNAQTDKQKEAAEKAEKAAQKAAEKEAAKEAARQAKYAEKAAEEEAKIAAKEAEKAAKKAEKEAEKMAKKAEKEAEKATKKIEKEADKMAKKAEKEAEKAAEKAEKAAVKKAEKEEKARQKEIMKGKEKELKMEEKAAAKAEKKAKKAAEKAAEAKEGVDAVTGATSVPTTEKAGYELKKPAMESDVDSLAYMFGVAQSNGLMNYLQNQLGVDSACLDDFCKGVMERAEIDQSDKKQYAYFQGLQIGGQIENMAKNFSMQYYGQEGKSVDTSIVASGVLAGLLGKAEMPVEGANAEFQKRMNAHKEEMNTKAKAEGDAKQKAFLDENRQKDGVKETASGLQYKVITAGNGPVPTATDKVKVHYEGHLIDGTEFDSSYQRGEPATFAANQVIKGWTEALCMMPVGSKWELYIPYDLAYGERAAGKIPPYSTLIFTVELLSIEQ